MTKTQEKHHTQESKEVSPLPVGDQKAARNRKDKHETLITKMVHKGSTVFERSVKIQESLNMFNDTKPHAHLQSFTKTHAKFHKIRVKLQGVAFTRYLVSICFGRSPRLTICRMRNRRFSKDIRAFNFRFRKEDPPKVNK